MVLYIIGIVGGTFLEIILNLILCSKMYSTLFIIFMPILAAILLIAIDAVIATVTRKVLPEKYFDHNVKFHNASKKECKFYEKLGVKFWKDHVLELGMFTNFSKREVANPNDIAYIERFILENNYGAILHIISAFAGFLLMFAYPGMSKYTICLPSCIINFILNMMPYMILRYNTDRLQRIRTVLVKKEERAKALAKADSQSEA